MTKSDRINSPSCSACGGSKHLRHSIWHGTKPICRPCFLIWYDCPADIDVTDPVAVGIESRKRRETGQWPWNDKQFA
jgi:hypothetical protein